VQGRLSASMTSHPNFLGLVAFGILMCALLVSNRLVAGLLIVSNLLVIVATQSRGSLVASLLGLLAYGALRARQLQRHTTLVVVAVAMVLILFLPWYLEGVQTSVSSLLFLDDKYRGLGTGFTGRLDAWEEAIGLFRDNPVLGVGFRMHEHYMTTLSSAHNGYLSLLAESGLLGTFTWLIVVSLAIGRLLRRALRGDSLAALGFSFSLGYLFLAAFERFFLNMGNPTSILTWLFLLMPSEGWRSLARARVPPAFNQRIWLPNTRVS
jgi:O-antigen ligase